MKNLFNTKTDKWIIPQGEGQTLTLSGQTNGRYYKAYSVAFMDQWFGGKRQNSFSVSAYFSKQTDVNSNYYSNIHNNDYNPYNYYGGGYGGYYGSTYGYDYGN